MRKSREPRKPSTLKNDILNGLGELALGAVVMVIAFVLAILLPTKNNDFEFYLLLAVMVLAVIGGIVLFVRLLVRELKRSKSMQDGELETESQAELVFPAHKMKLRPAPFAAIQSERKTLELRLNDEKRQKIKLGDTIVFTQTETRETLRAVVVDVRRYPDFEALYRAEDPLTMGYSEGETADPRDMSQYYQDGEIRKYGTLAIEIKKL